MRKLKVLMSCMALFAGWITMSAQAYSGQGDQKIQVGFSPYGNGTGITATYDYGLPEIFSEEIFSVGGGAEFYFDNDNDNDDDDENFYVFGRFDAHLGSLLNMPSNMDLYPGIDLGILGDDVGFGGHIGYRYFFNPRMGAYIELGSRGSLGLSINL